MPATIWHYLYNRVFRAQVLVIAVTLALIPLAPIPLELQRRLLDDAIANADTSLFITLSTWYVAALMLAAALKFVMRLQRELISARVVHALRHSVYRCIYTVVPPSHWRRGEDQVDEGAVVSMLSSEVEKLGAFAGSAVSGPLLHTGTVVSVLGYMFWVEPLVASIALALYSPQLVLVPLFQARLNRLSREKALTLRELGAFIVDNKEESLLSRAPPPRFTNLTEAVFAIRKRFVLTKNTMKTLNNVLIALGPFGVIAVGGWMAIEGRVELGVILAFVSGLEKLGSPIRNLIASYSQITEANMRYRMLVDGMRKHDTPLAGVTT